jgi:hypothetical protein
MIAYVTRNPDIDQGALEALLGSCISSFGDVVWPNPADALHAIPWRNPKLMRVGTDCR